MDVRLTRLMDGNLKGGSFGDRALRTRTRLIIQPNSGNLLIITHIGFTETFIFLIFSKRLLVGCVAFHHSVSDLYSEG